MSSLSSSLANDRSMVSSVVVGVSAATAAATDVDVPDVSGAGGFALNRSKIDCNGGGLVDGGGGSVGTTGPLLCVGAERAGGLWAAALK